MVIIEVMHGQETRARHWCVSGLGVALAHELARRGYDIALTARSSVPMEQLANSLRSYGIAASVHSIDLARPDGAGRLTRQLNDQGLVPDLLVNNAAFGLNEQFVDHDPARLAAMLQLNVVSLTELTHLIGRRMAERGKGHILLVASMAAYQPDPMLAAYGATKAYVLSLGEALNVELAPAVGVTVLSPGLMDTGFNAASGFTTTPAMQRLVLPVERVAKIGVDAVFAGRPSIIAGKRNTAMAFVGRFVPRHMAAKQAYRMSRGV